MTAALKVSSIYKTFTLHQSGAIQLPVLADINLNIEPSECVGLIGPSGIGKSTLLRLIYGNYLSSKGSIKIRHLDQIVDITKASAQKILAIRNQTIGYVSQFLRVLPRVSTLEIVAEPLITNGISETDAVEKAATLLKRLQIPEVMWSLSPLTFSGGEQQRVNIARGLVIGYPLLLLDEPTASLDNENQDVVLALIKEATQSGAAILGIFS